MEKQYAEQLQDAMRDGHRSRKRAEELDALLVKERAKTAALLSTLAKHEHTTTTHHHHHRSGSGNK